MQVKTLVVGELQTNCYLLWDEENKNALIIDPGDAADFIITEVLALKLKPTAIILTHGHFDHCLAADELSKAFLIPVYLNQKDLFLVNDLQKRAEHWLSRKIIEEPPKISEGFEEFEGFGGKIIETPGHTPGSVCLYFPKEKILFSGDTLFANGQAETNHSYSSKQDLRISLEKLSQFSPGIKIYPGHGEAFLLKQKKLKIFN
ncbi:MAG: MBL fold metallo-hydrolase [Patescibacteria group bacterium]|nr:MBL fold metallo-hydrolase [Patescibacteria group bacterium]